MVPAISIIMPCYNRAHDLINVLEAYERQLGDEPFELIAVDDASTDATLSVLKSFRPSRFTLHFERQAANQGPAAARNRGIAEADAPLLLIVGDDILPDENLVRGHLAAHRFYRDETVAILGRVVWPEDVLVHTLMAHIDGIGQQQFSYHYLRSGQAYDFRHFYTANISIRKDFLTSLDQWFDTTFTYAALEDAELAYRLSKQGLRIIYTAHLVGYHYHYHNIWSFTRRQRNSGLMANVLTRKHPGLRYQFRAQYLRLLHLLALPRALLFPFSQKRIDQLETITCRLLDFYEWNENPLLDWLYLAVLDHFYYDGFIRGFFKHPEQVAYVRQAHARYYLLPALKTFLRDSSKLGFGIPHKLEFDLGIQSITRDS